VVGDDVLALPMTEEREMRDENRDVLARARAGDAAAFEELMRGHERMVFAQALRLTGRVEDAQDISQEAFVRLYRNLHGMREGESIAPWLRRVVVNLCSDHSRRTKASRRTEVDALPDAGHMRTPEAEALGRERERALQAALLELGEKERAALVLRELEGLTTEEVAQALGSAPATVRVQIAKARVKLARVLRGMQR
jgi:RNA polymerase sigma-70 factor (ECF subfamily)